MTQFSVILSAFYVFDQNLTNPGISSISHEIVGTFPNEQHLDFSELESSERKETEASSL